jgi:hypothetical protein
MSKKIIDQVTGEAKQINGMIRGFVVSHPGVGIAASVALGFIARSFF